MSPELTKKQEILSMVDNAGISRRDFLEELELIGQLPFTDKQYEHTMKKFGIIQEVNKI